MKDTYWPHSQSICESKKIAIFRNDNLSDEQSDSFVSFKMNVPLCDVVSIPYSPAFSGKTKGKYVCDLSNCR